MSELNLLLEYKYKKVENMNIRRRLCAVHFNIIFAKGRKDFQMNDSSLMRHTHISEGAKLAETDLFTNWCCLVLLLLLFNCSDFIVLF